MSSMVCLWEEYGFRGGSGLQGRKCPSDSRGGQQLRGVVVVAVVAAVVCFYQLLVAVLLLCSY